MSDEEDSSAESSSTASDEGETERDWTPPPDWAPRLPSTSDPAARAAQLEALARRFLEGSGAGVALAEPLEEAFGSGDAFVRFLKKWLPKGLRPILMLVSSEKEEWWKELFAREAPDVAVLSSGCELSRQIRQEGRDKGTPDVFLAVSWLSISRYVRQTVAWKGAVLEFGPEESFRAACQMWGLEALGDVDCDRRMVAGAGLVRDWPKGQAQAIDMMLGFLSRDHEHDFVNEECLDRLKPYFCGEATKQLRGAEEEEGSSPVQKRQRLEVPPGGLKKAIVLSPVQPKVDKVLLEVFRKKHLPDWAKADRATSQQYKDQVSWQRWALHRSSSGKNVLVENSLGAAKGYFDKKGKEFDVLFYLKCLLTGSLNAGPLLFLVPPNREKEWKTLLDKSADLWCPGKVDGWEWPLFRVSSSARSWQNTLEDSYRYGCDDDFARYRLDKQILLLSFSKLRGSSIRGELQRTFWDGLIMEVPQRVRSSSWLEKSELVRALDGVRIRQRMLVGDKHLLLDWRNLLLWDHFLLPSVFTDLETNSLVALLEGQEQDARSGKKGKVRQEIVAHVIRSHCFDGERRHEQTLEEEEEEQEAQKERERKRTEEELQSLEFQGQDHTGGLRRLEGQLVRGEPSGGSSSQTRPQCQAPPSKDTPSERESSNEETEEKRSSDGRQSERKGCGNGQESEHAKGGVDQEVTQSQSQEQHSAAEESEEAIPDDKDSEDNVEESSEVDVDLGDSAEDGASAKPAQAGKGSDVDEEDDQDQANKERTNVGNCGETGQQARGMEREDGDSFVRQREAWRRQQQVLWRKTIGEGAGSGGGEQGKDREDDPCRQELDAGWRRLSKEVEEGRNEQGIRGEENGPLRGQNQDRENEEEEEAGRDQSHRGAASDISGQGDEQQVLQQELGSTVEQEERSESEVHPVRDQDHVQDCPGGGENSSQPRARQRAERDSMAESDVKVFFKREPEEEQQQQDSSLAEKLLELQDKEKANAAKLKGLRENKRKMAEEEAEILKKVAEEQEKIMRKMARLQVLQMLKKSVDEEEDKLETEMEEVRGRKEEILRDHQLLRSSFDDVVIAR